jgi:chemotaxis protein MotB
MRNTLFLLLAATLILQACVPQRKFAEMESRKKTVEAENAALKSQNEQLSATLTETQASLELCSVELEKLKSDTLELGKAYRQLRTQYDKINELNDILSAKNSQMLQFANEENKKLLSDLNIAQEKLQAREDALKVLEKTVDAKQSALKDREERLQELEALLSAQREASEALRDKVQQALLGFRDKGLSVSEKDGKVYVSMEAKLLFASGSTSVDPNGRKALVDLAKAIENEVDMEIIVEGHTDTDKISSASIPRDNWELSVLRATEVIKIMTANSHIKPAVLSAAGRSEYHPVNAADKSKNRRIEIILQPNLTELYNIIENK